MTKKTHIIKQRVTAMGKPAIALMVIDEPNGVIKEYSGEMWQDLKQTATLALLGRAVHTYGIAPEFILIEQELAELL